MASLLFLCSGAGAAETPCSISPDKSEAVKAAPALDYDTEALPRETLQNPSGRTFPFCSGGCGRSLSRKAPLTSANLFQIVLTLAAAADSAGPAEDDPTFSYSETIQRTLPVRAGPCR